MEHQAPLKPGECRESVRPHLLVRSHSFYIYIILYLYLYIYMIYCYIYIYIYIDVSCIIIYSICMCILHIYIYVWSKGALGGVLILIFSLHSQGCRWPKFQCHFLPPSLINGKHEHRYWHMLEKSDRYSKKKHQHQWITRWRISDTHTLPAFLGTILQERALQEASFPDLSFRFKMQGVNRSDWWWQIVVIFNPKFCI